MVERSGLGWLPLWVIENKSMRLVSLAVVE